MSTKTNESLMDKSLNTSGDYSTNMRSAAPLTIYDSPKISNEINLIVTDTPEKDETPLPLEENDLAETLSKSASRMEAVSKRSLFKDTSLIIHNASFDATTNNASKENQAKTSKSSIQNETILFEKSLIAEGSSVPNAQNQETNDEIAEEATSTSTRPHPTPQSNNNFLEPTLILNSNDLDTTAHNNHQSEEITVFPKKKPLDVNHSFFLNSLTEPNNTRSTEKYDKLPPNANDILGTSFMNENSLSTTNYAMNSSSVRNDVSLNQQYQSHRISLPNASNKPVEEKKGTTSSENTEKTVSIAPTNDSDQFKVPSLQASSKNEEETQFTDSELYRIDNLCQDMYEGHNKTLVGEEIIDDASAAKKLPLKPALCVDSVASKKIKKIEFVCSLLKPDIKVN